MKESKNAWANIFSYNSILKAQKPLSQPCTWEKKEKKLMQIFGVRKS